MTKSHRPLIVILSSLIPLLVAVLYFLPKGEVNKEAILFLPKLNATINSITTLVLLFAFRAIKNGKIEQHKRLMFAALVLSGLFLISYVSYHSLSESTVFGGDGGLKYFYYFVLLSHIAISIIIVPMVLISFSRALSEKFDKHKKIARFTLPLWLYVTITGVLVYFLIAPYY